MHIFNKYNVIYIIKYYCIDAISIFTNPGAITSSLSQIGKNMMGTVSLKSQNSYSRTPLIRPPSESHWCGRIRGMVAREGFVYEQKPLSVTRNVVV